MITSRCDCRCATCYYWTLGERDEMTTSEICRMLEDAYSVGMTDYVVWGGEPLLREDFSEIARHANSLGLDVTVITNGSRLPERINELAGHLYGLIVSIDHPDAERHDELRKHPGIYKKAVEGIKLAKNHRHLNIFINTVISRENLDQLERVVYLTEGLEVKIAFEMMEIIKGYNERLAPTREETVCAMKKLIQLKKEGHPISNSVAYFRSVADHTEYSCHVPKVLVTVEWDGNIRVCSTIAEDAKPLLGDCNLGNVRTKSFSEIFRSKRYKDYIRAAEQCWKCDLSYPREIALMYSLNRDSIENFMSKVLKGD
ncbi:MAG: radical SAM protein [Candidatus Poribacteria bacterium]